MNTKNIVDCSWVKLPANTYRHVPNKLAITNSTYMFEADEFVSLANEIDMIAPVLLLSYDIETERYLDDKELSNAKHPRDHCLTIGNVLDTTEGTEPLNVVFIWGTKDVIIPEIDHNGNPIPKIPIKILRYYNEAVMLMAWVYWISVVMPDIWIGYNTYGFDNYYLYKRTKYHVKAGSIPEWCLAWGRVKSLLTKRYPKKLDDKKEKLLDTPTVKKNYKKSLTDYKLTPSTGVTFLDLLPMFQNDTQLKLTDYTLTGTSQYFLEKSKFDLHYSQIKEFFYDTAQTRGILAHYNIVDCMLVLELMTCCGIWEKCVNMSRVNHVQMNTLYTKGMGNLVYGGMHNVGHISDVVIYRPNYHPVIDSPIFDDDDQDDSNFGKMSYWMEKLSRANINNATIQIVQIDENGKEKVELSVNNNEMLNDFTFHKNSSDSPTEEEPSTNIIGDHVHVEQPESANITKIGSFMFENKKKRKEPSKPTTFQAAQDSMLSENYRDAGGPRPKVSAKNSKKDKKKGFTGGCVFKPVPGLYDNTAILDFNSLYPNLMLTYFVDPMNLVLDERFANIPGVRYLDIRFNDKTCFRLAQDRLGILTTHTKNLITRRKQIQASMETIQIKLNGLQASLKTSLGIDIGNKNYTLYKLKEAAKAELVKLRHNLSNIKETKEWFEHIFSDFIKLSREYANKDSAQQKNKEAANSTFGYPGSNGKYMVIPISAIITFLGRRSLNMSKNYAETVYTLRPSAPIETLEPEIQEFYRLKKILQIIYGDTDSIFMYAGLPRTLAGIRETFHLGDMLAAEISKMLFPKGGSMKMVNERVSNIIMYSAKCYIMDSTSKDKAGKVLPAEIINKGLKYKKRDSCKFVQNLCEQAGISLLRESPQAAAAGVKRKLEEISSFPESFFSIPIKIGKKEYDQNKKPGHVILAEKMAKRDATTAPKTGQYVNIVHITTNKTARGPTHDVTAPAPKKAKKNMKKNIGMVDPIEDLDTVIRHKLPIDYMWYMQNQVRNALVTQFTPFMKNPAKELMEHAILTQIRSLDKLKTYAAELTQQKQHFEKINNNQITITALIDKNLVELSNDINQFPKWTNNL